jgi:signal transduction histidine kinase/ActR/RegA family two-component response regulator
MARSFRNKIAYKQAIVTVIAAFLLGFMISLVQLFFDLVNERQQVNQTISQILNTIEDPASEAAYSLNTNLASKVMIGLFAYRPIHQAKLYATFDTGGTELLAELSRSRTESNLQWLSNLIVAEDKEFGIPLYVNVQKAAVGLLSVQIDPNIIAEHFFDRAALILGAGFLRNTVLALILTLLFYVTLTRPILDITRRLSKVDIEYPDKSLVQIPKKNKGDELGDMIVTVNQLLHAVGTSLAQRREAEVGLRRSQERFRDMASATSDWFWEMNKDFQITFFSGEDADKDKDHAAVTFFADTNWNDILKQLHDPSELEDHQKLLSERKSFRDLQTQVTGEKGEKWSFSWSGVSVFNQKGEFVGYRGTTSDITRQMLDKQLIADTEEQLRQAQKMEAVGQLTGGVAHDFNNILAVVLGNLELIQELTKDEEKLSSFLEAAIRSAERGATLTQQLLSFSRKQSLQPISANLNELIPRMSTLLHHSLNETIEIKLLRANELWNCIVDPGQFENALLNLAINARDAMPSGGVLSIGTENVTLDDAFTEMLEDLEPGDYVMISMSDNGTGMTEETVEKALEPFYTTKEVGKGSGLGLSMVYGFIKQSGGHISVYSEEGIGTTIKLFLPRASEHSEVLVEPARSEIDKYHTDSILLVEDDMDVQNLTSALLSKLGYTVTTASNGQEALDILRSDMPINAVLADVILPGGMKGPDIVEQALKLRPGIKALFMSGYPEDALDNLDVELGSIPLISKPFRREKLANILREILDSTS